MTTVHRKPYSYTRNGKTVHVRGTTYERAGGKGAQPSKAVAKTKPSKRASLGTNLGIMGSGMAIGSTVMSGSMSPGVQVVGSVLGIVMILLSFALRSKGK